MKDDFKEVHRVIPVIIIAGMLLLALGTALWAVGKVAESRKNHGAVLPSAPVEISQGQAYDLSCQGVVKEIHPDSRTITVMEVDYGTDLLLAYTGASNILDKYNQIISMSQIEPGEIVNVYYTKEDNKIVELQISKEAWEYKGVGNLEIDKSERIMKISDTKYQYTDKIFVLSQNEQIGLIDINDRDELTVKGTKGKIWSVIVTRGHGYIRLKNYEQFIGGNVEVGYDIMTSVTEDMLIVAREGNYKITLEKDDLRGSKNVNVRRDQEVVVDMGDYMPEAKRFSLVEFLIYPAGAELFLDGKLTDYNEGIEVSYGEHVVKVVLDGYETYAGTFIAEEPSMIIEINLAEPKEVSEEEDPIVTVEDTDPDDEEEEEGRSSPSPSPSQTPGVTRVDYGHVITVEKPEGTEVYLNGKLKGTVPVSIPKEIGQHTITLRKSGYATRSYTVEVEDDSKDAVFVFEDLKIEK